MNELHFTIYIKTPNKLVWNALWTDDTFRQWAGIIDPGTYMQGQLEQGNTVQFISSENGYGVTSLVETMKPNELLVLRHRADTKDMGVNTRDDEWSGGTERYTLESHDEGTQLTVSFDVPSQMKEYFEENYPKALAKIKEIAENSDLRSL